MKKCVKLIFEVEQAQKVLESFVAEQADLWKIEGVGQQIKPGTIQIYICGQQEPVDDFIDSLYVGNDQVQLQNIKIETCPTDRSYRGVFRIVE